jgi:hypothetical protein
MPYRDHAESIKGKFLCERDVHEELDFVCIALMQKQANKETNKLPTAPS